MTLKLSIITKLQKQQRENNMNNISIVGRITKDIEVTTTTTGVKYARFNVAVQSEIKTADGERQADFFICVAWRENAENIAKYFKKGSPIGIVGSMNSRNYEKSDGTKQTVWEINVKNFSFVGGADPESNPDEKKSKSKSTSKKAEQQTLDMEELDDDDGLPF